MCPHQLAEIRFGLSHGRVWPAPPELAARVTHWRECDARAAHNRPRRKRSRGGTPAQVGGEIQVTRALPLAFYFHRRCLRLSCFFRLRHRAQQCKNKHTKRIVTFFGDDWLNAHLALACFIGTRLAARDLNLSMWIARRIRRGKNIAARLLLLSATFCRGETIGSLKYVNFLNFILTN